MKSTGEPLPASGRAFLSDEVFNVHEGRPNVVDLPNGDGVALVLNTRLGRGPLGVFPPQVGP